MNYDWERLGEGIHRCRLPFLDVTIGLIRGTTGVLLVDTGTTLVEGRAIEADVLELTAQQPVSHVLLTHYHFDHVLGSAAFPDTTVYAAPEVAQEISSGTRRLRAGAVHYGADAGEVDQAIAALRKPDHQVVRDAEIDLGDRAVQVWHPGRGHTTHDLVLVIPDSNRTVVFCGDLIEESGDPFVLPDSDLAEWPATLDRIVETGGPDAIYVPGHGAVVDDDFIARQQDWLRNYRA